MTKKISTKISTKRGRAALDFKSRIEEFGLHATGNTANPEILFVCEPIVTDFNKNPKGAINKMQINFMGEHLKGAISFDKVCFLTAAPPVDKATFDRDKAIGDHLKANRDNFANICKMLNPKLIIPMGKLGARQVYGRSVQITKVRGLPEFNEGWGVPLLPTLGIMHVMRYPENKPLFSADMDTLKRIVSNKYKLVYKEKIEVNYRWVDDLQFLIDMEPELLSVDIEGVGLNMMDPDSVVLTVQFCWSDGQAVAVDIRDAHPRFAGKMSKRTRKIIAQIKALLENPAIKVIGQNFKFDFGMLREKLGITTANYEWDTIVMSHIVDENMLTFNLDDLIRRYVPDMAGYADEFNRDPIHQGKTRMDLVPPDKMLQYGCGDVDAVWRLYHVLKEHFDNDPYFNNYYARVIRPALRAFCDIERNGFTVDIDELRAFEKYLREEQAKNYKKIVKMVPAEIAEEFAQYENRRNKITGKVDKIKLPLNITRAAFLVAMLFKHKKGLRLKPVVFTPSTVNETDPEKKIPSVSTKDHLPYFEGHPFVDEIITYIKNEKLLTTYVGTEGTDAHGNALLTGFYKYIKDGGIRPSYHLFKTDTGRTASSDPNGQNFPKRGEAAKRYRKMFVAPPGWALVSADFSQVELRIAAFLANETTMLRLFKQGIDLHSATAAKVIGKSLKKFLSMEADFVKKARGNAKPVNFGFLYGMWWRKFMGFARTQYGVTFTEKEAENVRKMFFELYPGLAQWHEDVTEQVMRDGYVRSPFGRIRHLPSVYSIDESVRKQAARQAINSPVQVCGSDLGLMAIGRLHQAGIPEDKFKLIGFIHDDIICMAKEEYAILAARTLKKYMETNPIKEWFDVEMTVDIVAEASIGYNLSDALEVNEYLADKSIKTLADLRAVFQKKLDALPDTPENEKKRSFIKKDLACITPPEPKNAPSSKRRIKLKSPKRKIQLRSAANANTQEENSRRKKIILGGRKAAAPEKSPEGLRRPKGKIKLRKQRG